MPKTQKPQRPELKFDSKRVKISVIYACASFLCFWLYTIFTKEHKYVGQFAVFFAFIFLGLFLFSIPKMLTEKSRMELYRIIGQGFLGFTSRVSKFTQKLKKLLGIRDVQKLYAEDEKSIVFSPDAKRKRKKVKPLTRRRFSQLTDDAERIRYLYASFVIKKRKEGEGCNPYHTPDEVRVIAAKNETEGELCAIYVPVRYAQSFTPASEEVVKQYKYHTTQRKGKL